MAVKKFAVSTTAKVFLVVVILECLDVIALTIERVINVPTFDSHVKISLLLCVGSLFLVYFAINGVITENKFELISFIAVTLLVAFYAIYNVVNRVSATGTAEIVLWIRFVSVCVFCPLNFILGWLTYKSFGWKIYRKIGANSELQSRYQTYQIFMSLVKMDLFMGTTLVLAVGMFQIDDHVEFYIDLAMLVLTIALAILGWMGIRHEQKTPVYIFLACSVIEPGYIIWKAVAAITQPSELGGDYFLGAALTIAVLGIITRVLLVIWCVWALKGFGSGLKSVFEKEHRKLETIPILSEA